MKKTIIALFALAGAAAADTVDTWLPDLLNSEGATTMTWLTGNFPTGVNVQGLTGKNSAALTLENVTSSFAADSTLTAAGWHATTGNKGSNNAYTVGTASTNEVYVSANDTFRFNGRQAYNGELVMCSVKVSSLITGENQIVSSLTLSFDMAAGTNGTVFSLWAWDGATAISLLDGATVNNTTQEANSLSYKFTGTTTGNTISVSDLNLDADDTIIAIWGNSSAGSSNTVSALTSSYTTATIPEPATATLSLLALASLAMRRRRASR